jgi:uncharacterized membrane protein
MKLNLSVKKLEEHTKYIKPFQQFNIDEVTATHFLKDIQREVVSYTKPQLNKFKKVCQITMATLGSTFMLGTKAFAETNTHMANVPGLMPPDIIPYGMWVIVMMVIISGFLAIINYILAGNLKMMKKRKTEAVQWQKDIIRGYADVLAAPIVIGLITLAATLLFGHFNWYIKPFQLLGN